MKPIKIKQILARYADIGRIYLAPEGATAASTPLPHSTGAAARLLLTLSPEPMPDNGARARRKKMGGNSGKKFTEGCAAPTRSRRRHRPAHSSACCQ